MSRYQTYRLSDQIVINRTVPFITLGKIKFNKTNLLLLVVSFDDVVEVLNVNQLYTNPSFMGPLQSFSFYEH